MDKATCRVLSEPEDSVYLSADEEWDYVIAEANINLDADGTILDEQVIARYKGENVMASREDVDYVDVSPKQIVSIAAGCIPFLENDAKTNRFHRCGLYPIPRKRRYNACPYGF